MDAVPRLWPCARIIRKLSGKPIPAKTRAFLAQLDAHLQSLPGFA
ncbi:hypothetical protein C404_03305 [Ralstonia sp. AU12-08]|nr:hypothetical protein C404_03305 [Ralstonia sp. AU12-08]